MNRDEGDFQNKKYFMRRNPLKMLCMLALHSAFAFRAGTIQERIRRALTLSYNNYN